MGPLIRVARARANRYLIAITRSGRHVPDEVFGTPYTPPVSDGSGQDRALLRRAVQLLRDAGCPIKDGKRVLPNGEIFRIEFLADEPQLQAHHEAANRIYDFFWGDFCDWYIELMKPRLAPENGAEQASAGVACGNLVTR